MNPTRKKFPKRSFGQLLFIQTSILILALSVFGIFSHYFFQRQYIRNVEFNIGDYLETLSRQIPLQFNYDWCTQMAQQTHLRISIIDVKDGKVICDSVVKAGLLPPLLDRPEFLAAISPEGQNQGKSTRFSKTLNEDAYYGARYLPDRGLVLRAGLRLSEMHRSLETFDQVLVIAVSLLSLILALTIRWTGIRLVLPYARTLVRSRTEKMHSDFLAHVSHELRTPLTSIKGFADTILRDLEAGRNAEKDFVEIISQDSSRLLALVNELLDLTAIDAGALKLAPSILNVQALTGEVLSRLKVIYQSKEFDVLTDFQVTEVFADPARITQILLNLAGNAMKYCPSKSQIKISWLPSAHGGTVLSVSDNGPGISEEDQKMIFERFYRAYHEDMDSGSKGAGLGLAIVRELALLHSAIISLKSEPGKGSEFRIEFPKVPEAAA